MRKIFKNAVIVSQNPDRDIIPYGYVVSDGTRIVGMGEGDPKGETCDEQVDLEGRWILPGFINSHVHLGESIYIPFLQNTCSLSEYLRFTDRLHNSTSEIEEKREITAKYSLFQLLLNGTTTIAGGRTAQSAETMQLKNVSGYMLMDSSKLGHFSYEFKEKFYTLKKEEHLLTYTNHAIFIHSLSKVSDDILKEVSALKNEFPEVVVMLHFAEDADDVTKVYEKWGESPVTVLENYNLLDTHTLLVHGNHLEDNDYTKIHNAGASLTHCFSSNLRVADTTLSLNTAIEQGINVVIGTDGVVTGTNFSVLQEARKAHLYHNRFSNNETLVTAQKCLDMITIDAAHALHLDKEKGSIEAGKAADFTVIDPPFRVEPQSIVSTLMRYEVASIFATVTAGDIRVWNGKVQSNEYREIQNQFSELVSSVSDSLDDVA